MAGIGLASLAGGFAEAAVLVLIARMAFALTSDADVPVSVGPIDLGEVAVPHLVVVAAMLTLARFGLQVWTSYASSRLTSQVLARLRRESLALYLASCWEFQAKERLGRLQELTSGYAGTAANAASYLTTFVTAGLTLAALLLASLTVNALAAVLVAVVAVAMGLVLRPIRSAVRRRSARVAQSNLDFATGVADVSSAALEIQVFGVQDAVRDRIDRHITDHAEKSRRFGALSSVAPAVYQLVGITLILTGVAVIYATGFSRLASAGAIVLIMFRSLAYGQNLQTAYQRLHETAPFVNTMLDEQALFRAARLEDSGAPVERIDDLTFESVSYAYAPGHMVLHEVSFRIERGWMVGIVGPSGAGKSTLVQILLRLREPTSGSFTVGGRRARELSRKDWTRRVAFVPQHPHLFPGTIADNIRFERPWVTDADVEHAARRAHVHDDILALPEGYATEVGARGGSVSGGQRQRLCIARALAGDPDVLVLDEPTSALDMRSEMLVRTTMAELVPEKTVVVIAHRLSTLDLCDRIMVLDHGHLHGFGTPAVLESSNAFYREALKLAGMR